MQYGVLCYRVELKLRAERSVLKQRLVGNRVIAMNI